MIVIGNSVYEKDKTGEYKKCVLHRHMNEDRPVYYLVATKAGLAELPEQYDVMSMLEIIAKFGPDAVDDDIVEKGK